MNLCTRKIKLTGKRKGQNDQILFPNIYTKQNIQ